MEKIGSFFQSVADGSFVKELDRRVSVPLIALGAVYSLCTSLRPLKFLWRNFLRPRKDLLKRYGGGWAVVTGASDGIGLAYSKELCRIGFKVAMVGRSADKLAKAAAEVKACAAVPEKATVKTIVFDFSVPYSSDAYTSLKHEIDALERGDDEEISILVNNVGIAPNNLHLQGCTASDISTLLQVNLTGQTVLTRHLLDRLVKRAERRNCKCAIVTVSSMSNDSHVFHVYGASKTFNNALSMYFSEKPRLANKIDFLSIKPGYVRSQMVRGDVYFTAPTEGHARAVFNHLGHTSGTYGHYYHDIHKTIR